MNVSDRPSHLMEATVCGLPFRQKTHQGLMGGDKRIDFFALNKAHEI